MFMSNEQVRNYILQNKEKFTKEVINEQLKKVGVTDDMIESSWNEVENYGDSNKSLVENINPIKKSSNFKSVIVFSIIFIFLILAVGVYFMTLQGNINSSDEQQMENTDKDIVVNEAKFLGNISDEAGFIKENRNIIENKIRAIYDNSRINVIIFTRSGEHDGSSSYRSDLELEKVVSEYFYDESQKYSYVFFLIHERKRLDGNNALHCFVTSYNSDIRDALDEESLAFHFDEVCKVGSYNGEALPKVLIKLENMTKNFVLN